MTGLNTAAIYVIQTLGSLYLLIVLLRFILQLVRADFYNPLSQFVVRATKPLLNPLRKIIPAFCSAVKPQSVKSGAAAIPTTPLTRSC